MSHPSAPPARLGCRVHFPILEPKGAVFGAGQAISLCLHGAEFECPKGQSPSCIPAAGQAGLSHSPHLGWQQGVGRERCLFVRSAGSVLQKGPLCLENTVLSLNQQHAVTHQILIRTQLLFKSFSLKAVGLERTQWEAVSCLEQGKQEEATCCACKRASREMLF